MAMIGSDWLDTSPALCPSILIACGSFAVLLWRRILKESGQNIAKALFTLEAWFSSGELNGEAGGLKNKLAHVQGSGLSADQYVTRTKLVNFHKPKRIYEVDRLT